MNKMTQFFHSTAYKNFWKFTLVGANVSGLLCAMSALIFNLAAYSFFELTMILVFAFWGLVFGFFAATIGFVAMLFMGRNQDLSGFMKRSLLVGFILATLISAFSLKLWDVRNFLWILVFPGIPFAGSIYFFRLFAGRYIHPILKKSGPVR